MPVFVQINSNAPSYDPIAFESVGLSQEDVPTTWLEFLRLVARLPEILQEFADISAFDPNMNAQTARAFLLSSVLDAYWEVSAQPGNAQKLDTPLFRQLMEAFEAIDFAGLNATGTVGEATSAPFVEHRVLFPTLSGNRIAPAGNTEYALFLSLREGLDPVFLTHLTAAFVNPYSREPELAMEYIEALAAELDEAFWIMTQPEQNTPVLNRTFELDMQRYDEAIASYTEQLERQSDAQRAAELEARLAEAQREKAEYEQTRKYSISPQSIAAYREAAQRMQFAPYTALSGNDPAGQAQSEIVQQYVQGLLSGEAFIATMDERFAMMELEGQ